MHAFINVIWNQNFSMTNSHFDGLNNVSGIGALWVRSVYEAILKDLNFSDI